MSPIEYNMEKKGGEYMENYTEFPRFNGGKHLKRMIGFVIVAIIAIILLFNSTYTIREQEQAVLTTFGVARSVKESGLHYRIPFIQKVQKVNTTIQGFSIGYDQDANSTLADESLMITSDYNFVNVDFFIEYRIADPMKAVYASEEPILILRNLAQSSIRNVIGSYDVDSVLTTGKNEIQAAIKEDILESLELYDIGIQLVNITIQDSEPPTIEVMEAFKAVETAKQSKETAINNANKYRNEKLPAALAEVDKIIKGSEADKEERINEANGQVARFNSMFAEYIKNPTVTKERMFYEAMEEILPNLEVIIDSGSGSIEKILPLEPFVSVNTNNTNEGGE